MRELKAEYRHYVMTARHLPPGEFIDGMPAGLLDLMIDAVVGRKTESGDLRNSAAHDLDALLGLATATTEPLVTELRDRGLISIQSAPANNFQETGHTIPTIRWWARSSNGKN